MEILRQHDRKKLEELLYRFAVEYVMARQNKLDRVWDECPHVKNMDRLLGEMEDLFIKVK